ncbi:MAG: M56 family metallopeptidase [Verrucomicrobiota bacterium]
MSLFLTSLVLSVLAAFWVWMAGRRDPLGTPWLTTLCLVLLVALPALALMPKVNFQVLHSGFAGDGGSGAVPWGWMFWLAGIVLMGARLFWNHWVLSQWMNDSTEAKGWSPCLNECAQMMGLQKIPGIRVKVGLLSPVVAGVFRPVILVPAATKNWGQQTRKMVILHEMGHMKRKDLWLRLAADVACALHWYNPLVWWLRVKLLVQCEYACDAAVVAAGADRRSYISALCDVVEGAVTESRPQGVLAMADHAPLRSRVERLLGGVNVGRSWLAVFAAALTIATALGLSLIRAVEKNDFSGDDKESINREVALRYRANPFPGN